VIVCAARYKAIVALQMNANAWQVLVAAKVVFRQIDPSSSHHTASNPRRLLFELVGADIWIQSATRHSVIKIEAAVQRSTASICGDSLRTGDLKAWSA
jgi:hypothetical protein